MRAWSPIALAFALAAAAPPPSGASAWSAPAAAGEPEAARAASPSDYPLGAADKVRVIVFNEPSLSGEFTVNAAGRLSLPLIGDVPAAGRTTSAVRQEIERKLGDGYLRDPRVSIDVLTYRPYFILGEVNKPGKYAYSDGLTVLNAVATAEGFTYRAETRRVFIKHQGSPTETRTPLTPSLTVAPGDTLRIAERFF